MLSRFDRENGLDFHFLPTWRRGVHQPPGKRAGLTGAISSGASCATHFARLYEQFRGALRGRGYTAAIFVAALFRKNIARSMKQYKVKRLANG